MITELQYKRQDKKIKVKSCTGKMVRIMTQEQSKNK